MKTFPAGATSASSLEPTLSTTSTTFQDAFQEGNLTARHLNFGDRDEMGRAYALRYEHFVLRKQWITPDGEHPGLECDSYDKDACHLTVLDGEQPVAYLRVLTRRGEHGFMLEREFRPLLPDEEHDALVFDGSVELSRLVVASASNGRIAPLESRQFATEMLLKLLYHTSLRQGWSRFYIVVEAGWPSLLARRFGLPFRVLGLPYVFPEGTATVAARAELPDLEAAVARHSSQKLQWYRNGVPPAPVALAQTEPDR